MAKVEIKHMRKVRAKGRTYWYHRRTGERLPEDEAARIRRVLEINEGLDTPSRKVKVGSVEAVANLYKASHAFKSLAATTRNDYSGRVRTICELWGDQPVASIQRKHVIALQDKFSDKPPSADRMVTVLRVLLAFAVEREYRADNPAEGVGKLVKPSQVEGHKPWPDWAIDKFRAKHAGTMMGLAFDIGLYTAQREGDVLRMNWSDIQDDRLTVRQSKTGTPLEIWLHADLKATLAAATKRSPVILTTERGLPFLEGNFRHHFRKAVQAAELGGLGLTFHGLRYAAASRLAEAGCSIHEIAAVTGHRSLNMLTKYTKGAEQRRMSEAAIHRLEQAGNAKVENRDQGSGKPEAKGLKSG